MMHVTRIILSALLFVCGVAGGNAQPGQPRATLVLDWRIKAEDHGFSHLSHIFVGPRAVLVVPVRRETRMAMFDSTGKRFNSIGSKGSGPGEFQDADGVNVGWKGDTIWMHDSQQRRVSYVAPDGKLIRTVADARISRAILPNGRNSGPAATRQSNLSVHTDGSITAFFYESPKDYRYDGEVYLVRIVAGAQPHAIVKLPFPRDERTVLTLNGYQKQVPFTIGPIIRASATGDRIAQLLSQYPEGTTGAFTVTVFKANGDTIFRRLVEFRGVPVSKASHDSAIAALASGREGGSAVLKRAKELAEAQMPTIYPEALELVVGQDNTIWIPQRKTVTGQNVLVLDAAGKTIGNVLIPPRTQLRQASRQHVWLTEDTNDEESNIVRYRVLGLGK